MHPINLGRAQTEKIQPSSIKQVLDTEDTATSSKKIEIN